MRDSDGWSSQNTVPLSFQLASLHFLLLRSKLFSTCVIDGSLDHLYIKFLLTECEPSF